MAKDTQADGSRVTVNDLLSSQGLLLEQGNAVNATLMAAPGSTKNKKASVSLRCSRA